MQSLDGISAGVGDGCAGGGGGGSGVAACRTGWVHLNPSSRTSFLASAIVKPLSKKIAWN